MVSIVVVGYKHSKYIVECLESVINQTHQDFELIVADDGSNDGTEAIVERWKASQLSGRKIKTKFNQNNIGFCNTLNSLIPLCEGEFIKILAADDKLHSTFIAKSIQAFDALNDEYGLVYSNAEIIDEHSIPTNTYVIPYGVQFPSGWVRSDLFHQNCIPALSVMVRKEVYDKVGLYDPSLIIEDYYMWMKMSRLYKFCYINEVLCAYRTHGENISLTSNLKPQVVLVKILNDQTGEFSEIIHRELMDIYIYKLGTGPLVMAYKSYTKRDDVLYVCLKYKLSYRLYKLMKKVW
jgi:glycosyltransferase involved in cell wall biosynthesis